MEDRQSNVLNTHSREKKNLLRVLQKVQEESGYLFEEAFSKITHSLLP